MLRIVSGPKTGTSKDDKQSDSCAKLLNIFVRNTQIPQTSGQYFVVYNNNILIY